MISNLLNIGEVVYNSKMNYVRIYIGPSLTNWLTDNFKTSVELDNLLSSFRPAISRGLKLVLDSSSEGEIPFIDLKENNQLHRLDWLLNWKIKYNIPDELFKIWVSDFNCTQNNGKYSIMFETMNQYKHNVAYALDNNFLEDRTFNKKFVCAMSRNSLERRKIWEYIESEPSMKENTYYSFNFRENGSYTNPEIDKTLPHLSLERYDIEPNEVQRTQFAGFQVSNKSIINILCETTFHRFNIDNEEYPSLFFTEKTFRPLAMCQPFIYVSSYGMLKKLKSYGFKTFDKWWDESYDEIENDNQRLEAIIELISNLNKKSLEELSEMYLDMISVLKHNYNNLFKLEENYYEFHVTHNHNEFGKHEAYYHHYFKLFN